MMRAISKLMLMIAVLALGSCNLPQTVEPVYKFPEGKRVLVFVDPRPNQNVPPEFVSELGQKISNLIVQFRGSEQIVPQARAMELRRDPDKLAAMSVSDVARVTEADLVLHVDVLAVRVATISDESLTQGAAQALVKVVDRNGKRLWPGDMQAGALANANVPPAFSEVRNPAAVQRELGEQLASRIARAFVKYEAGEPALSK